MQLVIETYEDFRWVTMGSWTPKPGEEARGFAGSGVWRYDMDFAIEHLHSQAAGVSLALPLVLDSIALDHWPAFMLDLLPGGPARKEWLELLQVANGPAADIPLLQHAGRAPVGCLRVQHATRIGTAKGFARHEVLDRHQRFLAYMRDTMVSRLNLPQDTPYSAIDSQGAAPKYLLTEDRKKMWWAEGTLADEQCARFWLVKYPRGRQHVDRLVLQAEAAYAKIAKDCGALVGELPHWEKDILFVPRFDRTISSAGQVLRYGLETLCSAMGVAELGHSFHNEELAACIARHSSDPQSDLVEFLRRDILNVALGNSDNHARNTSFLKKAGQVRLSPLYDFAPMELDPEGISRQARWQGERLQSLPWQQIVQVLSQWVPAERVHGVLAQLATSIEAMPKIVKKAKVPAEVVAHCQERWAPLAQSIREYLP